MADSTLDSHIRAYADLFIAKFDSIAGDWRQPWLPTLPYCAQNAAGHLYSGVNDVNLSLTGALRGFACPVWLTGSQCRDLGVLRIAGESGSLVYWGGTSFFDKEKGAIDPQMRWADDGRERDAVGIHGRGKHLQAEILHRRQDPVEGVIPAEKPGTETGQRAETDAGLSIL